MSATAVWQLARCWLRFERQGDVSNGGATARMAVRRLHEERQFERSCGSSNGGLNGGAALERRWLERRYGDSKRWCGSWNGSAAAGAAA